MIAINNRDECLFTKTERGREEVATRRYGLASRLRWLLVLVDGKTSKKELLQKVSGLGLDDQSLLELVNSDFIQPVEEMIASSPEIAFAQNIRKRSAATQPAGMQNVSRATKRPPALEPSSRSEVEQILALKKFFNQTVKSTLGLRGFSFQLKVERACSLQDFIDLRDRYIDAVMKAKGEEIAYSLRDRLDQHLGLVDKKKR